MSDQSTPVSDFVQSYPNADPQLAALFTPWNIGNVQIKNRIVMTSMGGTSLFGWMEPNHFDKEAANFLLTRAQNNVGLLLPGIAPVRNILFGQWLYKGEKKFHQLAEFMEEFHKTGAKLFVQLTAGFGRSLAINDIMIKGAHNKALGKVMKPIIDVSYLTASASATPNRWDDTCISRPLTNEEILEFVDAFARTSKLLKDAGVDGVEVHAVHEGYLLDQFTMKYTNYRTDRYGGSFENRYRFPCEIVQAIHQACGDDFPVSLRYSAVSKTKGFGQGALPGEDYVEVGRDLEESERAAKHLQDAGYAMLNCDNGTYDAWYWAHPPQYMPENCNMPEVTHIKQFVDIPVVCAGRMDPVTGARAVAEGKLDAVGFARPFLADPEWVTKTLEGRKDDIRPCICCHNACFNMAHYKGVGNDQSLLDNAGMARCALNPETMQTKKYHITPLGPKDKRKRVAIIGGGVGGMEAARVLALRGHEPAIFEASDHLGGIFVAAAAPDFKEKDKELLAWYDKQLKDLGVEVYLNHPITSSKDVAGYDEVIVATGATARKVPLPGIENAIEACDYLYDPDRAGDNVVVVGGGLTGCEIALDLHHHGKHPAIVEMKQDLIAVPGVCLANSSYLREYFDLHNVPVRLETTVSEIRPDAVVIADKSGATTTIPADTVIVSVGYEPAPLALQGVKVHQVGDCSKVGNLRTVIWQAWDMAMKL